MILEFCRDCELFWRKKSSSNNYSILKIILFALLIFMSQLNSVKSEIRCKTSQFRCSDGSACLTTEKLCNGVPDCKTGEDENVWDCSKKLLNTACGNQQMFFRCRFGGCISTKLVCDSNFDCIGGSDEASDLCEDEPRRKPQRVPPKVSNVQNQRPSKPQVSPVNKPNIRDKPSTSTQRSNIRTTTFPPFSVKWSTFPIPSSTFPSFSSTQRATEKPNFPNFTQKRPVISTTSTFSPIIAQKEAEKFIQPRIQGCPPLEEEEGIKMRCRFAKDELNCFSNRLPNGTIATYECSPFYSPTLNAPRTTKRRCIGNSWEVRKRRWVCNPVCGDGGRDIAQFIEGGMRSKVGKWPWHVGLYHERGGKWEYFCGGTLISTGAVLTAAHCVTDKDGEKKRNEIRLYFGKFYRDNNKDDNYVQMRTGGDIQVFEDYNSHTFASDIAVIKIKPIQITQRVQLACLPTTSDLEAGDIGTLVGWGRYHDRGYPDELQEAKIPVVSNRECTKAHPSLETLVKADTLCAGYRNGTSACDGDSGGGLVSENNDGKWHVFGIVSAGVARRAGGCDPNYYTVFTKVFKFRNFIDQILDSIDKR